MKIDIVFPGVAIIDDVFDKGFCEDLIAVAEESDKWERSRVIRKNSCEAGGHASFISNHRTCSQVFLNQLAEDSTEYVCKRVDEALELYGEVAYRVPEGMFYQQPYIVRYEEGQQFGRHSDEINLGGEAYRVYTATVYLNESMGGDLWFPKQGIMVENKPGRVCVFPSMCMYEHQSNPVVKGVKYSIPMWKLSKTLIPLKDLYARTEDERG